MEEKTYDTGDEFEDALYDLIASKKCVLCNEDVSVERCRVREENGQEHFEIVHKDKHENCELHVELKEIKDKFIPDIFKEEQDESFFKRLKKKLN